MRTHPRFSAIWQSTFVRSASVLAGGTAAAQSLTVLALPVLTRLYSPEDFSFLAYYVAILTLVTVISSLRLEVAIPLPEADIEAANLLALGLILVTVAALLVGVAVEVFGVATSQQLGQQQIAAFGWILPIGVWLAGTYAIFQFWASRKMRFPAIAGTRMMQAGAGLVAQIGLGLAGAGPVGLVLGHTLMAGAGVVYLAVQSWRRDRAVFRSVSWVGMRAALSRYRRFPQYSALEALANNAAVQMPVIMIAALAIGPEAGFVLLAMRAMGTPVTLIGGAVGQVYLSRAPKEMRRGHLSEFTAGLLDGLVRVGVAPMVFVAVVAPSSFSFVFGEEWRRAGQLAAWMAPWFVLKLIAAGVSPVMYVRQRNGLFLVLMIFILLLRVSVTYGFYAVHPGAIAEGFAVSGALATLISALFYARVAGVSPAGMAGVSRRLLLHAVGGVVLGSLASLIVG